MVIAAGRVPVPAPVGGPAARQAARDELARPGYDHGSQSVVTRFFHWIGHQFDRLFSGGTASHAVLLVVLILLVLAVVLAARAGVPRRARSARSGIDTADPLAATNSREHRRLAARLEAEQRHAEALREWLRAAVATIEERGILPVRPGRTGAQTAAEAGPLLPGVAESLATAMTAFDAVWFGGRAARTDDVAVAHRAADLVRSARLGDGSPSAPPPAGIAAPW